MIFVLAFGTVNVLTARPTRAADRLDVTNPGNILDFSPPTAPPRADDDDDARPDPGLAGYPPRGTAGYQGGAAGFQRPAAGRSSTGSNDTAPLAPR
ncbi:MAG: hypothetical protein U0807_18515 [Candidatus Binatia bacterium]